MAGKKLLLVITDRGKRYLLITAAAIITTVLINAIVLTHFTSNSYEGRSIIIDPGHGGIDGGTNDGLTFFEKDINLQIARKLQEVLEADRVYVSLTRSSDVSLDGDSSLPNRHRRDLEARVMQFNSGKYEMFISIHVNRSSNNRAIGPMVLYSPNLPEAAFLAECLQNRLNDHMKTNLNINIARKPVKSDFFILRNADIPGVIVETGFISNPLEKELLRDEAYQSKLARSIYLGVKDYFKNIDSLDKNKYKDDQQENFSPGEEDSLPFNITNEVRLVSR